MKSFRIKTIAFVTTVSLLTSQSVSLAGCGGGGGGYRGGFGGHGFSRPAAAYPVASTVYRHAPAAPVQTPLSSGVHRVVSAAPVQQTQAAVAPSAPQSIAADRSAQNSPVAGSTAPSRSLKTNGNSAAQSAVASVNESASPKNTEQSALEMLASIAATSASPLENPPSPSDQPQSASATISQPDHIGTWSATLPNSATIRLQLGSDGSFSWTATHNGKTSTFAGDYRVEQDRLSLVRDGDRQQLNGQWVGDMRSGYKFRLDGSKDSGLDFQRI